jgi:hypothetical protein
MSGRSHRLAGIGAFGLYHHLRHVAGLAGFQHDVEVGALPRQYHMRQPAGDTQVAELGTLGVSAGREGRE